MQKSKRTSIQWWTEMKADAEKFIDWLKKQYHGEITAHERILAFMNEHAPKDSRWRYTLQTIAEQELTHAR